MKILKKIYRKLCRETKELFNKISLIVLNIINFRSRYLYLYNYQLLIQKKYKNLLPFNWQEYYKNGSPSFSLKAKKFKTFYTISNSPRSSINENTLYGHGFSISQYANVKIPQKAMVEHGLFLIDHLISQDYYDPYNLVLTMSSNRTHKLNYLLESPPKVVNIGPYIHYAEPFYNKEQFYKIKKRLKRTILFFYTHSTQGLDFSFDIKKLMEKLNNIKKDFDSALVCFYFKDLLEKPEIVNFFLENKWEIVNCGQAFDIYFLERLKSLIELSDLCIGTDIGTHIGYCIYENRPYYHLSIEFDRILKEEELKKSNFKEVMIENEKKYKELEKNNIVKEILEPFSKLSLEITAEQKRIIAKYWGSNIRSKEELRKILMESQKNN